MSAIKYENLAHKCDVQVSYFDISCLAMYLETKRSAVVASILGRSREWLFSALCCGFADGRS